MQFSEERKMIKMYVANASRYEKMKYNRCGKSGLSLPAVSLGLWKNFGFKDSYDNMEKMALTAFDCGITYFDLANNYGNPYNGSAEENFKRIMSRALKPYRDEIVVATKAGFEMWDGPYGNLNGSRKYMIASLDQSLKRMGLDYVDIYYHHIFDQNTPLEETALALDQVVRQGKALYVGISNYNKAQTAEMTAILKELKTPFIVNQISYSMLNRWIENDGLDEWALENGIGLSVYSPLYQGLLTDKYISGVPADSRIGKNDTWIGGQRDERMVLKLSALSQIAADRGQKLSQLALSWVLHNKAVTTVIIGASRPEQVKENAECINNSEFSDDEISRINEILAM